MSTLVSAWALVFVPLTLGGSAAAAVGRAVFAWLVARFTDRLPADARKNALALSAVAHKRLRWPWLFVVFNTVIVAAARPVVSDVADLFAGRFGWELILVVAASVGGYVLFLTLPWTRWLGIDASAPAATLAQP